MVMMLLARGVALVILLAIAATTLFDLHWPGPLPSEAWIEAFSPERSDSLTKGLPRW